MADDGSEMERRLPERKIKLQTEERELVDGGVERDRSGGELLSEVIKSPRM